MDRLSTDSGAIARALVVDALPEGRSALAERLMAEGFRVVTASDGHEALARIERSEPDVVVSDLEMPGLEGLEWLRRLRAISRVPLVIITAFGSIAACEEAMRLGASRFLQLGRDLDRLGLVARQLVQDRDASREPSRQRTPGRSLTAEEARALGERELRERLIGLLFECRGNIAEVARRMGRDRSTVRYHLRRLDLLAPRRPASDRDRSAPNRDGSAPDLDAETRTPRAMCPGRSLDRSL